MNRRNPSSTTVVFDAYGTLLSNPNATRPFAQLRQILDNMGVDVSDYTHRAMTQRHTLPSLALSYGADVPLVELARLEEELMGELLDIRPYAESERVLRHVISRGARVVVASNLAWPYSLPIRTLMDVVAQHSLGSRGQMTTAFSFDVGHIKPSPEFYSTVKVGLASQGVGDRIFMVGDRQIEDVDGPTAAGWTAWRVDRSTGHDLLDAPWDDWLGRSGS